MVTSILISPEWGITIYSDISKARCILCDTYVTIGTRKQNAIGSNIKKNMCLYIVVLPIKCLINGIILKMHTQ